MVVWNAEADAKLLACIFNECGITLSQDQYKKLADVMGCTPKAVQHRLTKFRRGIALTPAGGGNASAATSTPRKRAPAPSGGKNKGKAAKAGTPEESESTGLTTRPPTGGKKRAQTEGDEEDGNLLSKKVKIEVGEDIGEGLRALNGAGSDDEFS